jgi:hypothetical protein
MDCCCPQDLDDGVPAGGGGTPGAITIASSDGSIAVAQVGNAFDLTIAGGTGSVLYDLDLTALATSPRFVDATPVSIGGNNWTPARSINAGATWGLVNGQGLVWTKPVSLLGQFNSGTQTASHVFLPQLQTLVPSWDPRGVYFIAVYLNTFAMQSAGDGAAVAMWGLAGTPVGSPGARMDGVGLVLVSGASRVQAIIQASQTNDALTDQGVANCIGMRVGAGNFTTQWYGVLAGGQFPTLWSPSNLVPTWNGPLIMSAASSRLAFAFPCSSNATPNATAAISRLQISRLS